MPDARRQARRTRRRRFLLPGGLLAIAALGALALVVPAASARASTTDKTAKTTTLGNSLKSCGPLNLKGVSTAPNSGNPFTSPRLVCIDGALILYGDSAITYANPPASFAAAGKL
ncbi:MAG: hypothetical protein ACLQRH_26175, partial [Acidimicrobiales bacterium]